ncbi:S1 family peptidase [Aestuariivirga sp.]|uniref:S1 family peptidase n=1 Tax=Aestuariivirga sp. TaxID=2650926 RepID=UPI0039E6D2A5
MGTTLSLNEQLFDGRTGVSFSSRLHACLFPMRAMVAFTAAAFALVDPVPLLVRLFAVLVCVTLNSPLANGEEWTGFKAPQETSFKENRFVNQSVVQIVSVGGHEASELVKVEMVDVSKIDRVKNRKSLLAGSWPTKVQPNLRALTIETCRQQGLRFCPVQNFGNVATGFVDMGKQLWMCRHSFNNWLAWASKANNKPVEQLSPPMIIYDKNRHVIYNSALAGDNLLTFSVLNPDDRVNVPFPEKLTIKDKLIVNILRSDIARLDSRIALLPPVSANIDLAITSFTEGTRLYAAGYPARTEYFTDKSKDTTGGKLVVSTGLLKAVSPTELSVSSSVLVYEGSSGSPIFRDDGSVIGVACHSVSPSGKDKPETVHTTSLLPDKWALQRQWQKLKF